MLVTITYVQQTSPDDLKPAAVPDGDVRVVRAEETSPEFHRYFYLSVGGDWLWNGRRDWNWDQWEAHASRPGVELWALWVRGTPAGYAVLRAVDNDVEIENFGLLPSFIGRGLGGHLLTEVVRRAWAIEGTTRVLLNTCSLDGPHALRNYEARGFVPYRTEQEERSDKDGVARGPWDGANRVPR
nr:acetyltransferase [Kibdelosporangium sp. MJ126-NF4]